MPLRLPYSSNLQSMWGLRHAESPGAQSETSNDNGGNGDAKNSNNAVQAPHRANHKMSHYRSSNAGSVKNFAIVEVVRHHVKSALPDLKVVEMLRARPLKRHEEQTMPDDGNYTSGRDASHARQARTRVSQEPSAGQQQVSLTKCHSRNMLISQVGIPDDPNKPLHVALVRFRLLCTISSMPALRTKSSLSSCLLTSSSVAKPSVDKSGSSSLSRTPPHSAACNKSRTP
eukprot:CAMPEP_0117525228 /NCGR_PEP_ID=MMETSP0784-20121206/35660_1 /TAXON_ID=39447 /ORGANISM="" /LENGTH=228 /DNA_ID=CAMNT_0005321415 /DNA_START=57 /DNA_END=744 /DNA_ORIENTATION=-